ncbi:WhiB family transcriptional regulator [Streptomyces sp. WAC01280]|uniref:WhiB family transcriptional regulator n=1 Tax=Streptomyces sp. WAC01280 TaxID=2487424 RepID=UPI000F7AF40C|nr:WhiB family transcriptional regulator [Streptomyces sp. WAC01280]RSS59550.1 hypothetical protein EF909_06645 [Streptomyces sp. WAC01280]
MHLITTPAARWDRSALCVGKPTNEFFPDPTDAEGHKAAVAVCGLCPVREECLAAALAEEGARGVSSRYGIRGGKTPTTRFHLYKATAKKRAQRRTAVPAEKPAPREPAKCGTRGGYQRHRRNGEEACPPCRQANTDADNRLRRTGTTKAAA